MEITQPKKKNYAPETHEIPLQRVYNFKKNRDEKLKLSRLKREYEKKVDNQQGHAAMINLIKSDPKLIKYLKH